MSRVQSKSQLQSSSQLQSTSQPHSAVPADKDIREAEARVREQEANVLRLIVQGAPTQSAEDLLRELTRTAEAMKAHYRRARR
jgi:FixJ family two-component response regulator